jgi:hypothetical protein
MKRRKIKYTKEPIGKIKIVEDFLPKPKDLVLIAAGINAKSQRKLEIKLRLCALVRLCVDLHFNSKL